MENYSPFYSNSPPIRWYNLATSARFFSWLRSIPSGRRYLLLSSLTLVWLGWLVLGSTLTPKLDQVLIRRLTDYDILLWLGPPLILTRGRGWAWWWVILFVAVLVAINNLSILTPIREALRFGVRPP
jgi:hypothetical protein